MTGNLIAQRFNLSSRADLWKLREYHGKLEHVVPFDDSGPNAPSVEESIDAIVNTFEDDFEQARGLA